MVIDWITLLDRFNVDYVTSGPSTAKGNVYVHCPFCGENDQGHHLGINLAGKGWGCWKSDKHRGRNPARLMTALFRISYLSAQQLMDGQAQSVDDEAVGDRLKVLLGAPSEVKVVKPLTIPAEIKPLTDRPGLSRDPFNNYLLDRGYTERDLPDLLAEYSIHYCISGLWAYRLVFPVINGKGKVLTFTGRTIRQNVEPRYMTVSTEYAISIKNCLWRENILFRKTDKRKSALIVCEGPFDAMRVDWFGRHLGIDATCLFGKTVSDAQEDTLGELLRFYQRIFVVLDPDAVLDNLPLADRLAALGARLVRIDPKYKDPAEMPAKAVEGFVKNILR